MFTPTSKHKANSQEKVCKTVCHPTLENTFIDMTSKVQVTNKTWVGSHQSYICLGTNDAIMEVRG